MINYVQIGYILAMIIGFLIGILGIIIAALKKKITALKNAEANTETLEAFTDDASKVFEIAKKVIGLVLQNETAYESMSENGVKCGELKSFNVQNALQKLCEENGIEFEDYDWTALINEMIKLINYNKSTNTEKTDVPTSVQQSNEVSIPADCVLVCTGKSDDKVKYAIVKKGDNKNES